MSVYGSESDPDTVPPIPEAFGKIKEDILDAIESFGTEGSFACSGSLADLPYPGLEIDGLGLIGLPLSAREARAVISKCHRSPFGKGEKTLTDTSIRSSWELDPSHFKITNDAWNSHMDGIVGNVYENLGLTYGRDNVHAELYKLLIYEEGTFFKSHQDSEKEDGMFGTLVISLPSKHEGGKVLLNHNGAKEEYDSAKYGPLQASFGAWYSDVYHEVQQVTSGFRFALVYNLIQHATDIPQDPPNNESRHRLSDALQRYEHELTTDTSENTESSPGYLLHKLEHFYSEHSLNSMALKGTDAIEVRTLAAVCESIGFEIYLGALEKRISEDQVMPGPEVCRSENFTYIAHLDGSKTDCKPLYNYRNLLVEDEEEEGHYAGSEHDEYTGNEGSLSTWRYKSSVVVMVPPSRKLEFKMSHPNKLTNALNMFQDLRREALVNEEAKHTLYDLCLVVIRAEKPKDYFYNPDSADGKQRKACMDHVILAAIEHGWLHFADKAFLEQSCNKEHMLAYGKFVSSNEISHRHDSLWKTTSVTLAAKYSILSEIIMTFKEHALEENDEFRLQHWYQSALHDMIVCDTASRDDDGLALCNIIETCGFSILNLVEMRLNTASLLTIVTFVLNLTQVDGVLELTTLNSYRKIALERLWCKFAYLEEIRVDQICELLELTAELDVISVPKVIGSICDAFSSLAIWVPAGKLWEKDPFKWRPDRLKNYIAEVLVPLIIRIIGQELKALVFEDMGKLCEPLSAWVTAILSLYIHRDVGKEPQPPTSWSIQKKYGCTKCKLCKHIMKFMEDSQKQIIEITITQKQKDHLSQTFKFSHFYDPFEVEINPKTEEDRFQWKCTKVHKEWKRDHDKWESGRSRAERFLTSVSARCSKNLEVLLGDSFEAIMSCKVEALPNLGVSILGSSPEPADTCVGAEVGGRPSRRKTAHQKRRDFEIKEAEIEEMMMLDMMMARGGDPRASLF